MENFLLLLDEMHAAKGRRFGPVIADIWIKTFKHVSEDSLIGALTPFIELGTIPCIMDIKRALGMSTSELTPYQKAAELVELMITWVSAGRHVLPDTCIPWQGTVINSLGGLKRFRDRVNTGEDEDLVWGKKEWTENIARRLENPHALVEEGFLSEKIFGELGIEDCFRKLLK
jgi:hypothetical protein